MGLKAPPADFKAISIELNINVENAIYNSVFLKTKTCSSLKDTP